MTWVARGAIPAPFHLGAGAPRHVLPADPSTAQVEVEVIPVLGVVVRAEYGVEVTAGSAMRLGQETAFGGIGTPVAQHMNCRSVRENKSGDIDGVGGRMWLRRPSLRALILRQA